MKPSSFANLPPELVARCLEFTPIDEVVRVLACDQRIGAACAAFRATTGCAVPVLSPTCLKRMLEPLRTIGPRDRVGAVAIAALDRFLKHVDTHGSNGPRAEMLACRKEVIGPLLREANVLVNVVLLVLARMRESGGRTVPVLLATTMEISADLMQAPETVGAVGVAAFNCHKYAVAAELDHFGIDLRLRREYQSEAHFFLDYGTRLRHGSLSKTLGFEAGGPLGTFDGCLVAEMWPAPGHPAVERLRAARTGPYKLLDMLDPHVRNDYFEIYNDLATVHTGDRTPAVYLAETEEHWHMPWPFG